MPVSLELRFPAKRVNRFAIISYFCDFFFVFCSLATNAKFFIFFAKFRFHAFHEKTRKFREKTNAKIFGETNAKFLLQYIAKLLDFFQFFRESFGSMESLFITSYFLQLQKVILYERCKCRLHQKIYINLYQLFKNEDAKINSNGVSNF